MELWFLFFKCLTWKHTQFKRIIILFELFLSKSEEEETKHETKYKKKERNSRVIGETIAGRSATTGRALAVVAAIIPLLLLLLIDDNTSMIMVCHTRQGTFQAVDRTVWLLLLHLIHWTATILAVGVDAVVIIVHFVIIRLLLVLQMLLIFRRRKRIRQSQSSPQLVS